MVRKACQVGDEGHRVGVGGGLALKMFRGVATDRQGMTILTRKLYYSSTMLCMHDIPISI